MQASGQLPSSSTYWGIGSCKSIQQQIDSEANLIVCKSFMGHVEGSCLYLQHGVLLFLFHVSCFEFYSEVLNIISVCIGIVSM